MDEFKKLIREVPDFPKPGILFYDITTLLNHRPGFCRLIDYLTSAEGQQRIAAFKVNGQQLFHPFAAASALAETPAGGGF